jgi:hypothetical protein
MAAQIVQSVSSALHAAAAKGGFEDNKPAVQVAEQEVATEDENLLVVSPYQSRPHLLDLNTVSIPCQLLARALTEMKAVRPDYATAPYTEAFNWPVVIDKLRALIAEESFDWKQDRFYIVVFRSQIPLGTNREHLGGLDDRSHAEAMASGWLLKYWFGTPDESGRNMATCRLPSSNPMRLC